MQAVIELSDQQLEVFFQGWTMQFALGRWSGSVHFSERERAVMGLAACYFAARCPQIRMLNAGLCFAACKVVRVIAREEGIRTEPLTVTVEASHEGHELSLGSRQPRLKRHALAQGTLQTWSGHEIIHFPDHGAVFDPTITQLSTWEATVLPAVAKAPAILREGDRIPAVLEPLSINATYTVQRANFDYMRMSSWPDIEQMANDGGKIVGPAADQLVATMHSGSSSS
ncbi:hypothetical protein MYCOZU1_05898 (plasmid) [Mycobacterium intracellulare subsp. chimaera]|nr:hypothetical protein MYCODSM44623_05690 [Mycobacterium intracellulare subsp. chimaera]ASL24258.1 hypothetical protein MYCOZU1_05898 [Mycobacterium intracellulare subsp. chimaera]